ncbi:hypothetical protein EV1_022559 [Malus domestica]
MASFSGLGIGLSIVFGCLRLALVAKLYYLICEPDLELGSNKDFLLKLNEKENVEISKLMRLHNLDGRPRFLFTIKEEENKDLELEDGKSRSSRKESRTRSLGDLILAVGTHFLSPMSSSLMRPANASSGIPASAYNQFLDT